MLDRGLATFLKTTAICFLLRLLCPGAASGHVTRLIPSHAFGWLGLVLMVVI
jgi:hypothetical protein